MTEPEPQTGTLSTTLDMEIPLHTTPYICTKCGNRRKLCMLMDVQWLDGRDDIPQMCPHDPLCGHAEWRRAER